ncbi:MULTISPECIES: peptidoglycan-binding protein [Catenuloplanes]|uniref:Peptidoglycan hydrolase-like protein with peptidoglycan-binding domain n=1 Tax=Catenuloplanes niger TaxID=587534 RepID=A0AAE4CPM4_9ACTN|nr:peptidoglycan-binding protein [Catenuloplanes niger]MDR7320771.1 peptidoglycan hydrolase-like protein with peptidoglycan-binding domain [Catenuloplanes niger]
MSRTRRWILVTGILVGAGTGVVRYVRTTQPRETPAAPRATTEVRLTTLVEGQTFKGRIRYAEAPPLLGRLTGTVTSLPKVGAVLKAGDEAYRVDDVPVILLAGDTPAFRAMVPGISGPDVRQLERALTGLGYTGFTADGVYRYSTAEAVRSWQKRLGVAQTGTVPLGHVIFTTGEVRVGEHRVRVGEQAGPAPLYEATSTERRVTFPMDPKHQRLAPVGGPATVVLADGREIAGTVAAVEKPAEAGKDATVTVKATDPKALDTPEGDPADVRLVVQERRDVLAVPVVALLALDGDRYGVEVVDGDTVTLVPVEVGLFTDGKVEIRAAGLAAGMRVSVPAS